MDAPTIPRLSEFEFNFQNFLDNLGDETLFLDSSLPQCYAYWWYAVPLMKVFRCLDFSLPVSIILGGEIKYVPGKPIWEFDGTYLPDDVIGIIEGIIERDLRTSIKLSSAWYEVNMKLEPNILKEGDFIRYMYNNYKEIDKNLLLRRESRTTPTHEKPPKGAVTSSEQKDNSKKSSDNSSSKHKKKNKNLVTQVEKKMEESKKTIDNKTIGQGDNHDGQSPSEMSTTENILIQESISFKNTCDRDTCDEAIQTNQTSNQYGPNVIDLSNEINRLRGVIGEVFGTYPVEIYSPVFKQLSSALIDSYVFMPEFMRYINPAILAQYALSEDERVMNVLKIKVVEDRRHTLVGIVNTRILRQIFTTQNFNKNVLNQPIVRDIGNFAHAMARDVIRELDIPSGLGKELHALLSQVRLMNAKITSTSTNQNTFFEACQGISTYVKENEDDDELTSPPSQYLCRSRSDSIVSVESASSTKAHVFNPSDDILRMIEREKQRREKLNKK